MSDEALEGWFDDPYRRHEARWLSMGRPTPLVRDFGVEGSDPVDDLPFDASSLKRSVAAQPQYGATDLRRADDSNRFSRVRSTDRYYRPWMGASPPAYYSSQVPLRQWTVGVDPARRKPAAVFLFCGFVGWSLFGAVLACAPAPWVAPVLVTAALAIAAQYMAWWMLGSSIKLLWPNPLRQMASMLGLPPTLCTVLFYASMAWVAVGAVVRWHLGSSAPATHHHWVLALAGAVVVVGSIPVILLLVLDRVTDGIGQVKAGRNPWVNRLSLRRPAGQLAMVFGTLAVLLVTYARLG